MNVKRKYILWILIVIAILFVIGYKQLRSPKVPEKSMHQEEKVVEVNLVGPETIRQTVNVIGIIRSSHQANLTAQSKGILEILFEPGQSANKGELLAQIVNEDIENNYKILEEAEEIAKNQLDRYSSLLKSGLSSQNVVDEKRSVLLDAQKRLSDAKITLEKLKIYAPFDGLVGFYKQREGSEVAAGSTIVNFYDPNALFVEFDLPLSAARGVNDGAIVYVNNEEYSLTHVQKMLDEDTHMCPAYVDINCADCIIGTAVDVSLVVIEKVNVIVIPFEAIFLREAKPFVYLVKNNKAALTPVELGIREKKRIEIKSGLDAGDKVIVYGHSRLYPDVPVKIHESGIGN